MSINASAKDYKYQTVAGDAMQTRIYTLDNGLKVYLSVNKEKPRIQTYIAVRTGSKNDPAETTGLAHYLEHLMFKGTKKFGTNNPEAEKPLLDDITKRYEEYRTIKDPALRKQKYHEIDSVSQLAAKYFIPNEYDKLMATIGAEGTNAFTSYDVTCYTEDIPSNEIENWAKIQSDRFQNMVIRGFHTELEAVYEEYNIGLSSDMNKCFDARGSRGVRQRRSGDGRSRSAERVRHGAFLPRPAHPTNRRRHLRNPPFGDFEGHWVLIFEGENRKLRQSTDAI